MRNIHNTQRSLIVAGLVSALMLGSTLAVTGAAAAEPTLIEARQFLSDLQENRLMFLESDGSNVVLLASTVCSSDGGSGCQYLTVLAGALPSAVDAARAQAGSKDFDEQLETFDLPGDIRSGLADAVAEDLTGSAQGSAEVTVSAMDVEDFVALLGLLDFAIDEAKASIERISN